MVCKFSTFIIISSAIFSNNINQVCCNPNYIDLTHPFKNGVTRTWPINKQFKFTIGNRGNWGNLYLENNEFFMPEHAGTHMDAPAHLRPTAGGKRVTDLTLDDLVGPGVKIDLSERSRKDLDTTVTIQDLLDWEEKHGRIPVHSVILLYSGQAKHYNDENKYFGREKGFPLNDTDHIHFAGFSAEAAQWLIDERDIIGVATDCASFDHGQSKDFKAHQIILGNGKWGLENVANLHKLPSSGFTIFNMVFKLYDGSGAPSRVFATFGSHDFSRSSNTKSSIIMVLLTTLIIQLFGI